MTTSLLRLLPFLRLLLGKPPSVSYQPWVIRRWWTFWLQFDTTVDYTPLVPVSAAVLTGHAAAFASELSPWPLTLVFLGLLFAWFVVLVQHRKCNHAGQRIAITPAIHSPLLFFATCFVFGWTLQAFHRHRIEADNVLAWVTHEPRPWQGIVVLEQCDRIEARSMNARTFETADFATQYNRPLETPESSVANQSSQGQLSTWRARARVESIESMHGWEHSSGRVELIWDSPLIPMPGERWRIAGRIKLPADAGNPREFDRREYLRRQRVSASISVVGAWREPNRARLDDFVRRQLSQVRWNVRERLLDHVPGRLAGLTLALILGWRDEIDEPLDLSFKASGLSHVLSISGLHVSLVMASLLAVGKSFGLSTRRAGVVASIGVCGYALLAGGAPTVIRSVILASMAGWGWLEGRRAAGLQGLAAAALLLSTFDPASVTDLGAQLSFLGVTALCISSGSSSSQNLAFALRHWRATHRRIERWPVRLAANLSEVWWTTSWVVLLTSPLVAYHFHWFTWGSWLLNAWISLPLALALLSALITALPLPVVAVTKATGAITALALWPIVWSTETVARAAPPSTVAGPSSLELLCLYGTLGWVAVASRRKLLTRCLFVIGCWGSLHFGLPWIANHTPVSRLFPRSTCVSFIDVGHGNATLVQWPDRKCWLLDAGSALGDRRAASAISSVLWHERVSSLEVVGLSHPDRDHFNAVLLLLDRFTIQSVAMPSWFANTEDSGWRELVIELRKRHIRVDWLGRGDRFDFQTRRWTREPAMGAHGDNDPQVLVHHPPDPSSSSPTLESDNAGSLVLTIEADGRRLLLPGDMEGEGASRLARSIGKVDWLAAPHHGSPHSAPEVWLSECQPRFLVVSAGRLPSWLTEATEPMGARAPQGSLHDLGGNRVESRFRPTIDIRFQSYRHPNWNRRPLVRQRTPDPCVVLATSELGCIQVHWNSECFSMADSDRFDLAHPERIGLEINSGENKSLGHKLIRRYVIETWRPEYERVVWETSEN